MTCSLWGSAAGLTIATHLRPLAARGTSTMTAWCLGASLNGELRPTVGGCRGWGDCQRLEITFATGFKRRLGAMAAGPVGFEWLNREALDRVPSKDELTVAAAEALAYNGLDGQLDGSKTLRGKRRWLRARTIGSRPGATGCQPHNTQPSFGTVRNAWLRSADRRPRRRARPIPLLLSRSHRQGLT